MDIAAMTSVISQVGFPIFVALWLLVEGRNQNKNVVQALQKLESTINILAYRENIVIKGDEISHGE